MTWFAELLGDETDLLALSRSFASHDASIVHEAPRFFLAFSDFDHDAEPRIVQDKANDLISVINGIARLGLDAWRSIELGPVHRLRDGKREYFMFPEPAILHFRGFAPTLSITRDDGSVDVIPPADPVADLASLAASETAVSNVLRLVSSGPPDWVGLYRILEIVAADVGGLAEITARGWCTGKSISLFKRTANSPGALGLDARHGAEHTIPPPKPMGLPEARSLVYAIIHAWLREKGTSID